MAKSKRKDKSAFRHKDKGESVPKGTARRTLKKARFFLRQADHSERRRDSEGFECYVEAAVLFGQSALEHLKNEMSFLKKKTGRYDVFKNWIGGHENKQLIKDLKSKRETLAHISPTIMTLIQSDEPDVFYGPLKETYENLSVQLNMIEAIIEECERDERFK